MEDGGWDEVSCVKSLSHSSGVIINSEGAGNKTLRPIARHNAVREIYGPQSVRSGDSSAALNELCKSFGILRITITLRSSPRLVVPLILLDLVSNFVLPSLLLIRCSIVPSGPYCFVCS